MDPGEKPVIDMPTGDDVVRYGDKVYRRRPWRNNTFALIKMGTVEEVLETDAEGNHKRTGNFIFVPYRPKKSTVDPLKLSKIRAKAPKEAKKPKFGAKPKEKESKPSGKR